ncbi:hypothetical protein C8J57DRAFT_1616851 [Mycena rebaudengoi]|nr:hypothetical protein C8J57DRAFT_1616851 [Mycena rebaudengoi]
MGARGIGVSFLPALHSTNAGSLDPVKHIDSRLPPELERDIFETAASWGRKRIPKLLPAARRVHALAPLLYHVLLFPRQMPAQQISISLSKPPDFFARHVRHLGVDNNVSRAAVHKILSVSTGIINLALFHGTSTPALIPYLGHIRPRRLAVNMIGLFAGVPDFTHCMFSNITHLDECKLLTALVVLWPHIFLVEFAAELSDYPARDPRFVMMICCDYLANWEAGARGSQDFWSRADAFIAQKRRGEISATGMERFLGLSLTDLSIAENCVSRGGILDETARDGPMLDAHRRLDNFYRTLTKPTPTLCMDGLSDAVDEVNVLKGKAQWQEGSKFDSEKNKAEFRQYEEACDRVKNFYKEQHEKQTVEFNIKMRVEIRKERARQDGYLGGHGEVEYPG